MHGISMRGLPIEIDPGLSAMLGPSLLQDLYFIRRCNTEAIQNKDGRPNRDTSRALDQGFVTAGAQRRGRHGLKFPRIPNLFQHIVQMITECNDLRP
jgi:hypothetical protein